MNYEFKTTFWQDFTIAELFGKSAIRDTFRRAFAEWKDNYIYLTELVIVTNWKIWEHYEHGRIEVAKIYDEIWKKASDYAINNLKDEELAYYLEVTD